MLGVGYFTKTIKHNTRIPIQIGAQLSGEEPYSKTASSGFRGLTNTVTLLPARYRAQIFSA